MPIKILLAPLDWGLGHATRCIPIIKVLAAMPQIELQLAASDNGYQLYRSLFPTIVLHRVLGYDLHYGSSKKNFLRTLLLQLPRIMRRVAKEKSWLAALQAKECFDIILSDNRYGMHVAGARNLFMTHQVNVLGGKGDRIDRILARVHRFLLRPFDTILVVDNEGADALAPRLSKPILSYRSLQYIGLLSQFSALPMHPAPTNILVLLSGPEPMRTQLQDILLQQLMPLSQYNVDFVLGTPHTELMTNPAPHIRLYGLLATDDLALLLQTAKLVICRSGYSTVMDLMAVGRRAILIPTPGQTEQEYLAEALARRTWAYSVAQDDVALQSDISMALDTIALPAAARTVNSLDHFLAVLAQDK